MTVIVVLGPGGMELARRLRPHLEGCEIHGLAGRVEGADHAFADTAAHLRELFAQGRPIVAVCAAGIVIRALAPAIADKGSEPPVVAVAEDGGVAVPLLGGHRGANRLARTIAKATGGTAAVTTGGDVRFGLALDDPPPGWRVANRDAAKNVMAALLAAEPVALVVEAGDAGWLSGSGAPFAETVELVVRVTERALPNPGDDLVLHPPVLALGVGCERGCEAGQLSGLVERTLDAAGLAAGAVACVASLELKADEAAVHAVAEGLGVPARFFTVAELEAETPRLANPSEVVFDAVGCHGVAEGAALAAAGPGGELVVEKTAGGRATCAVARARGNIDPATIGRPRGRLAIVGVGPGVAAWRTPEATAALREATDVVGYRLYLDLVSDLIEGKGRHQTPMTREEERVVMALELAAEGRSVALVCSGDAGIYALAALVFELLEREDRGDWNRLAISVVPGVSAFQAAAARVGAPLGHDFCAVSLSDLLTPWRTIEERLKAAAAGDFIVALYNPVSKRRKHQIAIARDILLGGRDAATPVVVARNLGRDGESVEVITLGELSADHADMLTTVIVGNRQTRVIQRGAGRWVYTPRGYAAKMKGRSKDREQDS